MQPLQSHSPGWIRASVYRHRHINIMLRAKCHSPRLAELGALLFSSQPAVPRSHYLEKPPSAALCPSDPKEAQRHLSGFSYLSLCPGIAEPRSQRKCNPPGMPPGRGAGTRWKACLPWSNLWGSEETCFSAGVSSACHIRPSSRAPCPTRRGHAPVKASSLQCSSRSTSSRPCQLRRSSTWKTQTLVSSPRQHQA